MTSCYTTRGMVNIHCKQPEGREVHSFLWYNPSQPRGQMKKMGWRNVLIPWELPLPEILLLLQELRLKRRHPNRGGVERDLSMVTLHKLIVVSHYIDTLLILSRVVVLLQYPTQKCLKLNYQKQELLKSYSMVRLQFKPKTRVFFHPPDASFIPPPQPSKN